MSALEQNLRIKARSRRSKEESHPTWRRVVRGVYEFLLYEMYYLVLLVLILLLILNFVWGVLFLIGSLSVIDTAAHILDVAVSYTITTVGLLALYILLEILNRVLFGRPVYDQHNADVCRGVLQLKSTLSLTTAFGVGFVWMMYGMYQHTHGTHDVYTNGSVPLHVVVSAFMVLLCVPNVLMLSMHLPSYILERDSSSRIVAADLEDDRVREKSA